MGRRSRDANELCVLIDFENLQPELLKALDFEHFRVLFFISTKQTKVPVDFEVQPRLDVCT